MSKKFALMVNQSQLFSKIKAKSQFYKFTLLQESQDALSLLVFQDQY